MQYNFDKLPQRRGTHSMKWDAGDENVLPFWVADMDFSVAPAIQQAILRRAQHDIYGYVWVQQDYYESVARWFERRHNLKLQTEWMTYTAGVVPAIAMILRALTTKDDCILIQTPVYNHFFYTLENSGRETVCSPLVRQGDTYVIDFDDFERRCADERVKVFLLCNPQNPVGRVWTREELQRMADICLRHGVTIIADEIHGELTMPDYEYTPFVSLSEEVLQHTVMCTSATKAFNIAGLLMCNITCADPTMRERINHQLAVGELRGANPFGLAATMAAYDEGADWLDALRQYLYDNYLLLRRTLEEQVPQCEVIKLEGTYLVWVDCRALGLSSEALEGALKREAGIWLNAGSHYGEDGDGYMRWNIGCPRKLLTEGLQRFVEFVKGLSR